MRSRCCRRFQRGGGGWRQTLSMRCRAEARKTGAWQVYLFSSIPLRWPLCCAQPSGAGQLQGSPPIVTDAAGRHSGAFGSRATIGFSALTLGGVGAIVVAGRCERYAACVAAGIGFSVGVRVLAGVLGLIRKRIQLVIARAGARSHGEKTDASKLTQDERGGWERQRSETTVNSWCWVCA